MARIGLIDPTKDDMWVTCNACKWVACFGSRGNPVQYLRYCMDCGSLLTWKPFTKQETNNMIGYVDEDIIFNTEVMYSVGGTNFMGARNRPDLSQLIGPDKNDINFWKKESKTNDV